MQHSESQSMQLREQSRNINYVDGKKSLDKSQHFLMISKNLSKLGIKYLSKD
jgi:hypothetical protein